MKLTIAVVGALLGEVLGFSMGVKTEQSTRAYYVSLVTHSSYWQVLSPSSRPWMEIIFRGGQHAK